VRILVVNAGSSSLKVSLLEGGDRLVAAETLPAPSGRLDEDALRTVLERSPPVDAIGHRIVHGGTELTQPILVDPPLLRRLEALTDLAPLHQPKSLRALEMFLRLLPAVPAVACFDTAFHATIPPAAATYALPAEWRQRWNLRRFGFHGLSHAYAARRAVELVGCASGGLRVVTCHLGAGASLAAVRDGRSIDTTMGFTPLEGLVMATRSGSVDPGLLLWLEEHVGMPPSELATTLEHRSGLVGLTGQAGMSEILDAEAGGGAEAALGVAVYLHRLRAGIAAMAAALQGIDVLVFTGGVGENAPAVRARAAAGLDFLGIRVAAEANESAVPDCEITASGASVRSFVVEAREDLEIARGVRQVLEGERRPPAAAPLGRRMAS
jgi:acetate kinase